MLTDKEANQIREQFINQINSQFPEEKRREAIAQVRAMNNEQLEGLMEQNKKQSSNSQDPSQCVFCSIIKGNIPSTQVGENDHAVAVLELNPVSHAHTIIIPKEHITSQENMPKEAYDLAYQIGEKIKEKFKPKEIKVTPQNLFGHELINLVPVYTNEDINSPKKQSTPDELKLIQEEFFQEKEEVKEDESKIEILTDKDTWLPRRIP